MAIRKRKPRELTEKTLRNDLMKIAEKYGDVVPYDVLILELSRVVRYVDFMKGEKDG